MIDSHQHFWKYDPVRDSWINDDMKILKGDFLPENFSAILTENKIDGCIAVQADQSENETNFLLDLADQNPFIKGVVGWVDLCAANIHERLEHFSAFNKLKGIRHIVQAEPKGFLAEKKFHYGISQLEKFDLTYDILIYHHQLSETIEFVKLFPNQKFVVDHLAKPDVKQNGFEDWSRGIEQLAKFENVLCKISGFTTEAVWEAWTAKDFIPYFEFALQHFGTNRLLYGSDWPVCLLAATYKQQLGVTEGYISKLSISEKQQIMGGNAIHFYNL